MTIIKLLVEGRQAEDIIQYVALHSIWLSPRITEAEKHLGKCHNMMTALSDAKHSHLRDFVSVVVNYAKSRWLQEELLSIFEATKLNDSLIGGLNTPILERWKEAMRVPLLFWVLSFSRTGKSYQTATLSRFEGGSTAAPREHCNSRDQSQWRERRHRRRIVEKGRILSRSHRLTCLCRRLAFWLDWRIAASAER